MKKVSKTLAIVLCLVMILSLTALANWTEFGKTSAHNHVVTTAPTSSAPPISEIKLLNAGGGWDGVDTEPLMRTVVEDNETITYAYVLYDAHAAGGHLAKINCSATTPYKVWDRVISGSNNFLLSTPLLVEGQQADGSDDVIYLASAVGDKYTLTNVSPTLPTTLSDGIEETITASISNLKTTSNRVAMGIYLGRASTSGAMPTTGEATISIGGNPVSIELDPDNPGTGTLYKTFEKELYDSTGQVIAYDYYWYINHNVSGTANSAATVTVEVTLYDGTGTIEYLDVYANQGSIQKVTGLYATADNADTVVQNTTIVGGINGQINTPITTDGTYIYFGTYTGYSTKGKYYQVNLTPVVQNGITTYQCQEWETGGYGFYWAGAACDDSRVYFGSDNGMLYWRSRSAFNTTGGSLNLKDTSIGGATNAGNVRSTIMIDSSKLYFTSQGGYLWCCSYDTANSKLVIDWKTALRNNTDSANVTCTSTPTKVGNRIYVGCYGGTGKSGVKYIDATTHQEKYVIQDNSLVVQCSIVVKGTGTDSNFLDYLFFCTNAASGKGYCYSWDGTTATLIWDSTTATPTWSGNPPHTPDCTYALGGMSIDNGIAVCGNDHNYVYIVK